MSMKPVAFDFFSYFASFNKRIINRYQIHKIIYQIFLFLTISVGFSYSNVAFSSVGKVVEMTGPTEITRNKKSISGQINAAVEMQDTVTTAKSRVTLSFEDKTTVKITEQAGW